MGGEAEGHKLASHCFLLSLKANLKTMQKQIVRIEEYMCHGCILVRTQSKSRKFQDYPVLFQCCQWLCQIPLFFIFVLSNFFLIFHFQTFHTLFFMIKYLPIVWSGKKTKQNKQRNMEKLNEGMSTEMQSCSKVSYLPMI